MTVRYYITEETQSHTPVTVEIKKRLTTLQNSDKVKIIKREIKFPCWKDFVE